DLQGQQINELNRQMASLWAFQQRPPAAPNSALVGVGFDDGTKAAAPAGDESAIRFIVTDVLKKQDEEKKKKEEEAKQKLESEGYRVGTDLKMSARWDDGFRAETPNKDFTIHIGGRMQFDNVWWTQDPVTKTPTQIGDLQDGVFFRRVRIQM